MMYEIKNDCQITGLDNILTKYLGYKNKGWFVEVGAFDGETHSNTSFLADLGWDGLYIEPVKEYADKCYDRHKFNSVRVAQVAIGDKLDIIDMNMAGEFSTSHSGADEMYRVAGLESTYNANKTGKTEQVNQVTLNMVLQKYGVPGGFDLLVLDCEGSEVKALQGFNCYVFQPKMVIVEMHEQSEDWTRQPQVKKDNEIIRKYFEFHNYMCVHSDPINSIFVREDVCVLQ